MLDIYDELKKLTTALNESNIPYALCGGLAMAVHGRARATIDIDLLIPPESLNEALSTARELGYTVRGLDMTFADGAVEIRRISKIDSDDGELLSLDLLLVTPEIQTVWDSRMKGEWEGGNLFVVSPAGLIRLKRLRGSGQDLDDIKQLSEASADD